MSSPDKMKSTLGLAGIGVDGAPKEVSKTLGELPDPKNASEALKTTIESNLKDKVYKPNQEVRAGKNVEKGNDNVEDAQQNNTPRNTRR